MPPEIEARFERTEKNIETISRQMRKLSGRMNELSGRMNELSEHMNELSVSQAVMQGAMTNLINILAQQHRNGSTPPAQ